MPLVSLEERLAGGASGRHWRTKMKAPLPTEQCRTLVLAAARLKPGVTIEQARAELAI